MPETHHKGSKPRILCITSAGKDPETGRIVAREYRITGPTQIILTDTALEMSEDALQNRCVVLSLEKYKRKQRSGKEATHGKDFQGGDRTDQA